MLSGVLGGVRVAISIYYDGDCPFCSNYVQLVRLREAVGPVRLIDLRTDPEARDKLVRHGLDPDMGMAVETDGEIFHGAKAMTALSLMSGRSGVLNRLFAALFRHGLATRLLYPFLRAGRNATLFILGRHPMRKAKAAEGAVFEIFSRAFGLFILLHAIYYIMRSGGNLVSYALFVLGVGLFMIPRSPRLFAVLIGLLAVDGYLRAPSFSNHTILNNFFVLAMLMAAAWNWLKGGSWEAWFHSVQPIGRSLLLIMYLFGVFHKINSGFLNPEASCAVTLWRYMPAPLSWIDHPAMDYLAIYGTFAVEGAIFVALLLPRWRHLGIAGGIGFHALLALSSYAMYAPFSTLTIALHTLFISPASALKITSQPLYASMNRALLRPAGVVVVLCLLGLFWLAIYVRNPSAGTVFWGALMAVPAILILLWGRVPAEQNRERPLLWSSPALLNLVSVAFFLNCMAPYLGLKTAQAMNMFANIRVEGAVSNHLIFSSPLRPFRYLDDIVTVQAASGAPLNRYVRNQNLGLVYYEFLSILDRHPGAVVSYSLNGKPFTNVRAGDLVMREGAMLHPPWVRKFFHFRYVALETPVRCGTA